MPIIFAGAMLTNCTFIGNGYNGALPVSSGGAILTNCIVTPKSGAAADLNSGSTC